MTYYTDSLDTTVKAAQDAARAAVVNKPYVDSLRNAALAAQTAAQAAADNAAASAAAASAASGGSNISLDTDGTPYFNAGAGTAGVALDTDGTPYFL